MPDLQFTTHAGAGTTTTLHAASIDELQSSLDGRLLLLGTAEYEEARTIWNAMIDRRPALIVRCLSTRDVANAVNFARENNIVVAVRGGGHNIAGNAVCDGGLMIDLSQMRGVDVDPVKRVARVDGGALLSDVDEATQVHGLVTPLGINSTTGVAGLTLGGGFGWLSRRFGLSIDNLIGAEVVIASGDVLHASETENADLFWGIRGGGGNFGIVTSFEFKLHEIGQTVLSGIIVHPIADAKKVLQFYRDYMNTVDEEFMCWFVMRKAPPAPFIPQEWHGRDVLLLAVCVTGPLDNAERLARPLRELGNPIADIVQPMPFVDWQKILDPAQSAGARNYWKSHDFMELSDGLIDVLIDAESKIPDPNCDIAFALLGGAVGRVPNDATAYSHRESPWAINIHGRWVDPAMDEACIAWARNLYTACTPFSTGTVYVNFLTAEEGDRVRSAYGPNYDRLVALKDKYDPTNLFRLNQNIKPSIDHQVEGVG
jgi:FAD/FMN-containing dehydrogenase